jgi:hypothetical protein
MIGVEGDIQFVKIQEARRNHPRLFFIVIHECDDGHEHENGANHRVYKKL